MTQQLCVRYELFVCYALFAAGTGVSGRQYNTPTTANEIAVIMPGDGESGGRRDIILYGKGGGIQHIDYTHKNYDTFAYILFHIHGDECAP